MFRYMNELRSKCRLRLMGLYSVDDFRHAGADIGTDFRPARGFSLNLHDCWLITIGNNVSTGPDVILLGHDATFRNSRLGYVRMAPINIGSGVFIGSKSVILPGVDVGDNAVIAAGSVVTRNVLAGTIVGGSPARQIGVAEESEDKLLDRFDGDAVLGPGWKKLTKSIEGRRELRGKLSTGEVWAD